MDDPFPPNDPETVIDEVGERFNALACSLEDLWWVCVDGQDDDTKARCDDWLKRLGAIETEFLGRYQREADVA